MKKLLSLTLALLLLAACKPSEKAPTADGAPALQKVSIVLNWFPEAEHGGFYAAQLLGYYAEAGLEVEVIPGGVDVPVIPRVATGSAQFGCVNADIVLLGRAEQAPVVATMAPIQTTPRCLLVHADSGVEGFGDLKNMTLIMSAKDPYVPFLQKHFPLEGCSIVPYAGNVAPFLVDKKSACQGYVFSEPFVARQQGATVRNLMVADAGYNPYASCIITSEELLEKNPELVRKFTQASVRGWETYMKDPVATNQHINKLNPQMSMEILDFGVQELQALVFTDDVKSGGLGAMSPERWNTLVTQMVDIGVIKAGSVKPAECFTAEFLAKK